MSEATRSDPRHTVAEYFDLVAAGAIRADDRIELLEGVIVAMAPQNPPHASATCRVDRALKSLLGEDVVVRVQSPMLLGEYSAPEPDVAVVPGRVEDYDREHPTNALLVVEVAESSLPQDRLTKGAIYAAAGIAEYWLVNLVDGLIEVRRRPDPAARRYREIRIARRGEGIDLVAFPGRTVAVGDLLPAEG